MLELYRAPAVCPRMKELTNGTHFGYNMRIAHHLFWQSTSGASVCRRKMLMEGRTRR